jgi:CRP-like cAMP-binding protein
MLATLDWATEADCTQFEQDEHPIVRETVAVARAIAAGDMGPPSTLEKMIPLRSIGIFNSLEPEDLAQLARGGTESWFTKGDVLYREGEIGDEVFVLLTGEISIVRRFGEEDRTVAVVSPGSCLGELAVLDPAPRDETVLVATPAARVLRLSGASFREALSSSPTVSEGVIRMLVRRLRGAAPEEDVAVVRHA